MAKVFLHVGMPKCASSTIQLFFAQRYETHIKSGFCYPISHRDTTGYCSHRPLHNIDTNQVSAAVKEIAAEAQNAQCNNVFISSEELTNSRWDRVITPILIHALNAEFGDENVTIMFVLRNHFSFVESVFAQFLKGGMFRIPANDFFKRDDQSILGYADAFKNENGFDFFSYKDFVGKFKEFAPKNQTEIHSIEKEDLNGQSILDSLCQRFNLPNSMSSPNTNARYSSKSLLLLHRARGIYGFNKTRERRDLINRVFNDHAQKFSPLIHISGNLFDRLTDASQSDETFFDFRYQRKFEALHDIPTKYIQQKTQLPELDVTKIDQKFLKKTMETDISSELEIEKLIRQYKMQYDGAPPIKT